MPRDEASVRGGPAPAARCARRRLGRSAACPPGATPRGVRPGPPGGVPPPRMLIRRDYHEDVGPETVSRHPFAEHPAWARAFGDDRLAARMILPVVVSGAVEDRERVEGAGKLERLSLTELVRDARAAASAGFAGLLVFGASDRKDARAFIASERDHIVTRAIRAVKEAVPELGVATDVCVCAYTDHGQCVLFREGAADVAGTLERLGEIAVAHAEAGADLVVPAGLLHRHVAAGRPALPRPPDRGPGAPPGKLGGAVP